MFPPDGTQQGANPAEERAVRHHITPADRVWKDTTTGDTLCDPAPDRFEPMTFPRSRFVAIEPKTARPEKMSTAIQKLSLR